VSHKQRIINGPVLVLVGPTAIGKTELSFQIAEQLNCEIVSVDSMQVYRHMDIGTAKPSLEERHRVPHHLIDIVDPREQYDAARFVSDSLQAIDEIASRGRIPLLTGGTGLYLQALTDGLFVSISSNKEIRHTLFDRLQREGRERLYRELQAVDPVTGARIHINDTQRLIRALEIVYTTGTPWSEHLLNQPKSGIKFSKMLQLGLTTQRSIHDERIIQRTKLMLEQGLVQEVEKLRDMGYSRNLKSMQAIGYRHAHHYLDGHLDLAETRESLIRDTRRYAKRQMTWFKRNPAITWYDRADGQTIIDHIRQFMQ